MLGSSGDAAQPGEPAYLYRGSTSRYDPSHTDEGIRSSLGLPQMWPFGRTVSSDQYYNRSPARSCVPKLVIGLGPRRSVLDAAGNPMIGSPLVAGAVGNSEGSGRVGQA